MTLSHSAKYPLESTFPVIFANNHEPEYRYLLAFRRLYYFLNAYISLPRCRALLIYLSVERLRPQKRSPVLLQSIKKSFHLTADLIRITGLKRLDNPHPVYCLCYSNHGDEFIKIEEAAAGLDYYAMLVM